MRVIAGACAAAALLSLGGARAGEDPVRVEVEVTGIGQEVTSTSDSVSPPGAEDAAATVSGRLTVSADLGRGLSAVFTAEGWEGDGFDPVDDLRTLVPVNGDIALRSSRAVTEAYLTAEHAGTGVRISAGKVNMSRLFCRSRIARGPREDFTNYSFYTPTAVDYPGGEEAPYSYAAWATVERRGQPLGLTLGWASMDDDFDESYLFGEIRLTRSESLARGLFGWQAAGPRDLLDGTGTQDGAAGFGAYVDWLPRGDFCLFAKAAFADESVGRIAQSWSAGLQVTGTPWNRPADAVGVAYAQSITSDDDPATNDDEHVFEVYYRLTLVSPDVAEHRPGIEVCPHLQRISNPGGVANDRKTALWGVRVGAILLF